MNDTEFGRWLDFQSKHKKAKRTYNERHSTGIADKIVAIAKYRFRTIKEDISDYDSW